MTIENEPFHIPGQPVVPLESPYADARGTIQPLLERSVRSVAIIHSNKGAIRANHCHQTDWHYCYVVFGSLAYYERPVGDQTIPEPTVIAAGQMFFTPPGVEHVMHFLEDSAFLTFSRNPRDHAAYEGDVTRVSFAEAIGLVDGRDAARS